MTTMLPTERRRSEDTSVGKALVLLDAFAGRLGVIGLTALAERADVPKPTAHRLLKVLVAGGYVHRVGDRYCLSEHVFEMGNQVRSCRPHGIRDVATPYLGELFVETRQTVQLAVLSGDCVVYLHKMAGRDAAPCPTSIGARRPVYATALGKALLAFADSDAVHETLASPFQRFTPHTLTASQFESCLDDVRQNGFATDHEELRRGVNCVAAPVLNSRTGRAVAAVSVCSTTSSGERRIIRALERIVGELSSRYSLTAV